MGDQDQNHAKSGAKDRQGAPGEHASERVVEKAPSPQVGGKPAPHYVSDYGDNPEAEDEQRKLDHEVKGTFPASDPTSAQVPTGHDEPRPTVEQLEAELAKQRKESPAD
jgi:hypothetical protein